MDEINFDEEFVIKWKIQNFRACSKQNGITFVSPQVASKSLFNSEWILELCLGGDEDSSEEYLTCYLKRRFTRYPSELEMHCNLSVNGHQMHGVHTFEPFGSWGKSTFPRFNSKSDQIDLLEIECHMKKAISSPTDGRSMSNFGPCAIKPNPTTSPTDDPPLIKNTSNYNEKCYIRSRILEERASFDFSIEDTDLKNQEKKELPKIKFFACACDLSSTLQLRNEEEDTTYLEAGFSLMKHNQAEVKPIFASVFIHRLDSLGKVSNTAEYGHLFDEEVNGNWNVTHQLRKENKKSNENTVYLCLEILVSKGEIISDVDYLVNDSPEYLAPRDSPSCFSKEILRFYKEKKFCDVTLRTEDKSFYCHRVVLCAMSPVLANLLGEDMDRSNPCIFQIEDIDSQTVDQVINFIYTGTVQELDFNTAKNLLLAAVEYRIDSLKLICSGFLKRNLNHENVCEVLCFADEYNDNDLKQSVVGYISTHRNEILRSSQWKDLEKKDIHLAFETINSFIPMRK